MAPSEVGIETSVGSRRTSVTPVGQHGVEDHRHDRDDQRAEHRVPPEALHVEAQVEPAGHPLGEPQHDRVEDEREQPEGQDEDGQREDRQDRLDDGVEHTEDQGDRRDRQDLSGGAAALFEDDAVDEQRRHPQGDTVDQNLDEKGHGHIVAPSTLRCMNDGVRLRKTLEGVPAYTPGKPAAPVEGLTSYKISSNENPYPPLDSVLQVVGAATEHMIRYPDMAGVRLREALAERWGVPASHIATGTGSVGVLTQLINITYEPGDEVVYAWRSFEAYPI